ncbi:hypothetical protein [Pectobacterium versatile]|uniref:hypothetical protein n=1 Tax=Pectobacterium versatile TaxID=2488639 RepID=UPI001F39E2B6|nr:hypothetical protein [Pectobacterium versatile]
MTTLSTAQLIEAMRTVAVAAETEQGREKLNAIANRMEMLVAANADMDLQLNSIRSALNIPDTQSVQSGVIDAFSRKSSDIEELTEKSNRLRRTAKEHHEENQQLRTELAELRGQKPIGYVAKDAVIRIREERSRFCSLFATASGRSVIPVYPDPVPPAASQSYTVPDELLYVEKAPKAPGWGEGPAHKSYDYCIGYNAGHKAAMLKSQTVTLPPGITMHEARDKWGLRTDAEQQAAFIAWNTCLRETRTLHQAGRTHAVTAVPMATKERMREGFPSLSDYECVVAADVWNACRAAMLQKNHSGDVTDMAKPAISVPEGYALVPLKADIAMIRAGGKAAREYMEECGGNSPQVIYQAMLAVAPKLDRKDGDAVSRELMARGVEQAASGFHEKAFVAFEGSNEPGLYIRAQLQLLAQQLRDGDA